MSQATLHTFIAYVEDLPGVLNRVTSLLRRRNYNIVSLTVGRTERPGVSRMTIVLDADDDGARRIEANLYKLVNVLWVETRAKPPTMVRELALIKVRADGNESKRSDGPRARPSRRVSSTSGPKRWWSRSRTPGDKIDGLVEVLQPVRHHRARSDGRGRHGATSEATAGGRRADPRRHSRGLKRARERKSGLRAITPLPGERDKTGASILRRFFGDFRQRFTTTQEKDTATSWQRSSTTRTATSRSFAPRRSRSLATDRRGMRTR
jgi:acetolactate synthase-1/3 small subunit